MCFRDINVFRVMNVFSDIDIQLDFSLLAEANASLSLQRITPKSSPTLRDLLIPWYVHAGIPVFHRDDEDKTLFPSVHRRLPEPGD
jgi:hypothetical protein